MKRQDCEFEAEVLLGVRQGRCTEEVRAHVAECEGCSDAAAVAAAFEDAREEALSGVRLPDAGRVWRQTQMRARREAVQAAGRPITVAQVIAFGAAMGVLGACFGATSQWFQAGLASLASIDAAGGLAWATGFLAGHGALALGMLGVVVGLPAGVLVVLGRD